MVACLLVIRGRGKGGGTGGTLEAENYGPCNENTQTLAMNNMALGTAKHCVVHSNTALHYQWSNFQK